MSTHVSKPEESSITLDGEQLADGYNVLKGKLQNSVLFVILYIYVCFCWTLLLLDAGSCLSQAGSTSQRNLSFDGIYTPTRTPNQQRKTLEKHLEPKNLEG